MFHRTTGKKFPSPDQKFPAGNTANRLLCMVGPLTNFSGLAKLILVVENGRFEVGSPSPLFFRRGWYISENPVRGAPE